MPAKTDVIKTAGRIFEVLEFFDQERRPLGLVELVGRFQYPQSSMAALSVVRHFETEGSVI